MINDNDLMMMFWINNRQYTSKFTNPLFKANNFIWIGEIYDKLKSFKDGCGMST